MKQPRESDLERKHWISHEIDFAETLDRINHLITDAEGELDELDLEILHAKSILDGLLVRRQTHTERICSLRYSISSVKKLPAEILGKIFVHCGKETWDGFTVTLPITKSSYPWPLGRVCSQWRSVLWDTPEVWSRIKVYSSSTLRPRGGPSPVLQHVLSRTSGLVDLYVSCGDKQILNIVSCHQERFKGLRLQVAHLKRICTMATPFVALESLRIEGNDRGCEPPQDVSSHWPHFLPWSQLAELDLSSEAFLPYAIHSILSHCSSIVTCYIRTAARARGPVSAHGDIVLHKLKSLSLVLDPDPDVSDNLFRPLVLPALEMLTFHAGYFSPGLIKPVVGLVQRSCCHLRKFELSGNREPQSTPREPVDVLSLFQVTPSLVEFRALGFVVSPSTFEHMLPHGLVPHIKSLKCYVLPEGLDAFLDLMEYYSRGDSQGSLIGIQFAYIRCLKDLGAKEAFGRFKNLAPKYKADGRNIDVWRHDF